MSTIRDVLDVKGRQIHSIDADKTVLNAVDEMCRVHVGALLVVGQADRLGILSERDVMSRVILKRLDPSNTSVQDVMTTDIVCIDLDASLEEAMAVMTNRRCRHLPVVVDRKIVGVVSIGDLVRAANSGHQYELRMLRDYVGGSYPT